ncbi:MAG TPA: hypothetical protein VMM84_11610 [Pyrinomonadaceae bacterium]|nr:hypothetical protein [Pyrinomonadaceae bacterium]
MDHQDKPVSRRQILQLTVAVGGITLIRPHQFLSAQEGQTRVTPSQTMGPFYPRARPLDEDADLTLVKGKRGKAQGKVIHVMGRVLDSRGVAVAGAKVELWQANTFGRYDHPADINPAPLDPNFQGFGAQVSDGEGRYRFKTIKPGAYPVNPMNPNNQRPPHLHFNVIGHNGRVVTQMYFPDEPLNERDFIFNGLGQSREAVIAKVLPPTKEVETDSLIVAWDIILAKG